MRLGVITDGISHDLDRALDVMLAHGLREAELQYVDGVEVGDLDGPAVRRARASLRDREVVVSCVSRHLFAGMTMADSAPGDALHRRHMDALARCIETARELDCPLVRIMTGRKEQILWGSHGAERWNVATGAWDAQLALLAPAVELARAEGTTLVVETGNGTMVNSCRTAKRLIDELDAKDVLRVLWDPANACWAHELAWPDGLACLAGGYLGHVHVKDVLVDVPGATLEVRPLGEGQLGPLLPAIAAALREDGYAGSISFESVYHPGDGDFEAGFRLNANRFRALFGDPG